MKRFDEMFAHSRFYIAVASVALVFVMIIGFFECSKVIDRSFTGTLQDNMSSNCKNAVESLSNYMNLEQKSVEYCADLLSTGEEDFTPFDYADAISILNSLCAPDSVVSSGIIHEDDSVLMNDGSTSRLPGLSFSDVSSEDSYVSSLADSRDTFTGKVIRIFAPVFENDRVESMLFISIDPSYFSHFFLITSDYSDDRLLLIVDAVDNSIIYSTYSGDDADMQSLTIGSPITDFSLSTMSQGQLSTLDLGDRGQLWDYYSKSFSLGQWYAITMVKHTAGLSMVDSVSSALIKAFIIMLIPLLIFLLIIIVIEHRTLKLSRAFSDSMSYMYHIGFTLSNAAMDPERITEALGIMAGQYSCTNATFMIIRYGKIRTVFSTDKEYEKRAKKLTTGTSLKVSAPELYEHLLAGDCIVVNLPEADDLDHTDDLSEQIRAGKALGIMPSSLIDSPEENVNVNEKEDTAFEHLSNRVVTVNLDRSPVFRPIQGTVLMCVPIRGNENTLSGILIVSDPQISQRRLNCFESFSYISSVAPDFALVSTSIEAYALIKNMGTIDFTTGLLNRNAYKNALEELDIEDGQAFACIFIDVNGLHEMNNTYGHDKGDEMLHFVADTLKTVFPDDEVFRIGGDEFIIFARNHSMSVIDLRVAHINRLIAEANYAVSVGVEWREHNHDIQEMITAADHKMYAAKKRYYETAGRDRRSRDRRAGDRREDSSGGDRRAEDRRGADRRQGDRSGSNDNGGIVITPDYTGPDRRRREPEESGDLQSIMDKYKPSGGRKGSISEILAEAEQAAHLYVPEDPEIQAPPAPPSQLAAANNLQNLDAIRSQVEARSSEGMPG